MTTKRCYCPGDCACRIPWRTTICGCRCADLEYTFNFKTLRWEK